MENIEDIEERVGQLYNKIDDINAELYSLGGLEERIEFFERLRELISQKEQEGDSIAASVLGWAYEELSNV